MVTASQPSFDAYRANTSAALRLLVGQQHWREQILKLEQRRLERDREALEGMLETSRTARDWTDFAIATQSVWRDYLGASAALWQEGVAAAMQDAGAWTDTARDLAQHWQDACAGAQSGKSGAPRAMPMREWMNAFERAVNSAANGVANGATHAGKASRAGHAQRASEGGGQHGR